MQTPTSHPLLLNAFEVSPDSPWARSIRSLFYKLHILSTADQGATANLDHRYLITADITPVVFANILHCQLFTLLCQSVVETPFHKL